MKTNQEHYSSRPQADNSERGNALIYVLIAIALFAALSFTLSKQTDTNEAAQLDERRAGLYATQLISTSAQVKSTIDQMLFLGSDINELDFTLSTDASFETAPLIHKVYHPQGGGLNKPRLGESFVEGTGTDPVPGWYLGRFNDVEWTATNGVTDQEVILLAYQIPRSICEKINEQINGSTTIPTMTDSIKNVMIDESLHTGTNVDLTTDNGADICPECDEMPGLCVENAAQDAYGFYTVIADQ